MDYFDDLLKRPSLFLNESKLDANFTPLKIPHREKELSLLSQLFLWKVARLDNSQHRLISARQRRQGF